MTDDTRALRRKGQRVAGMFVFMIGAGLILESPAPWLGAAVLLLGLGLWAASFVAKRGPDVLAEEAREES
jgi:hypothetical protein